MTWDQEAVLRKVRTGAMQGVVAGTELVHDHATFLIMNPPKTGHIYTRRGVKHQASAPGEAPASDTGNLVGRSTTVYDPQALKGTASWRSEHALHLETGTEKMAPRPFARRALAEKRAEIEALVADGVRRALAL